MRTERLSICWREGSQSPVSSVALVQTNPVVTPNVIPMAYTRAMVVLCEWLPNQPVKRTRGAASSSFASAFSARRLPAFRWAS
jgi:hypothetical protein